MKKIFKFLGSLMMLLSLGLGLVSCSEEEAPTVDMTNKISTIRKQEKGTVVNPTGIVAKILYAGGGKQIPTGFYLVDDTGSIYVYGEDVAKEVEVGNKVTISGKKDYWIQEKEMNSAEKFGYKGCNQIAEAKIENISYTVNDFDKSWITESTVKDILDTDAKEDITTTIYKVNALVKKEPGHGFTNYYFYDIDGKTGSYTYSQCNGSDFAWLDEFDGKICTVYLSPLNAKATSAGITYRFLPVAVKDEGYKFDLNEAPSYALKYEALPLFGNDYMLDPELELPLKVSNESLGIKGVELKYESANTEAVYFEKLADKVIMHTKNASDAETKITVTASLNNSSKSSEITINTLKTPNIEYNNVKFAIDSAVGTKVTIKGVVGASLVNQDGFYLIDKTGIIAVRTTTEVLGKLKLGNQIIVEGEMALWGKLDSTPYQLCIKNADLLLNGYGKHSYSTDSFVTGKSLGEIANLDITDVKQTASAYVVENCEVKVKETQYYSSISLECDGKSINLYSSSASQYNWLKEFAGQKITVHIAPCNWNSKRSYSGCVLAVVLPDGTRVANNLNFNH